MLPFKGPVPSRRGKNQKIRKSNFLVIVWSQYVFQCFNFYMKNYQCSKLNTYLDTIFLSEWGYCVYIEIALRFSPAPTFGALKNERSDVTFVNIEWHDRLTIVTFMLWYLNRTILWTALESHLCVILPCDLTSWLLMTVTRDNYQPLVIIIVFDGCFHARMESKSFWYDSRNISFVLL